MQSNDMNAARAALKLRDKWSNRLAHLARALTIASCLLAWILVCVAALNAGPVVALAIVAVCATLFAIPFYVVTNEAIRARHAQKQYEAINCK